ncbi:universal stress protein [Amycolatopsis rhabdoformis]|uniref:Universal stress protein n=1 Tax=Amycolatopsis rhabdoformis TaxID=1448059 RepID=A0ABZ1IE44_9PSEU|nr:universal stress protein [Amycolatopsis rhabdoformis]WSE32192.1 universal stress protein [Amycolatopsis rhabdoformis]
MTAEGSDVIVVGVDGSAGGAAALRWTLSEARVSGREVVALRAWTVDPVADPEWATTRAKGEAEARCRWRAEQAVAQVLDGADPVPVRVEAVEGAPGPALVRAARNAAMLVVGSHGHGRLLRLLVGSVSAHCLRESRCPVVVVPARTAEEQGPVPDSDVARTYQLGPLL